MRAKLQEREKARRLRKDEGMPMKQIALRLGVSSGSVHLWTRDIAISPEHAARNLERARAKFSATWSELNRARRRAAQLEGRARAREGDPLHLAGCMLYWGEGHKSRGSVRLTNSDPNLLAFFRWFLTECFDVQPERLTVSLHVYLGNGLSIEEIESHWLGALELPRSCLRKHMINPLPTSSSGKKRSKLPYGVCRLSLDDTRIVQHIYGAIQEYGGFEEPRWLDGPPIKRRPAVR
jgi:transcriptional regulator with XRE-family HTH domain